MACPPGPTGLLHIRTVLEGDVEGQEDRGKRLLERVQELLQGQGLLGAVLLRLLLLDPLPQAPGPLLHPAVRVVSEVHGEDSPHLQSAMQAAQQLFASLYPGLPFFEAVGLTGDDAELEAKKGPEEDEETRFFREALNSISPTGS